MKILIVQTSFLGDTILSTPVIKAVKGLFPDASLTVMTTPLAAGLLASDPLIDAIIPFDKRRAEKGVTGLLIKAREIRRMGFDRVYSLHRSPRTSLLLFLARIPVRIGFSDARLSFLYTGTAVRSRGVHAVTSNLSLVTKDMKPGTIDDDMRLFPPPAARVNPEVLRKLPAAGTYAVLAPGSAWKTKQWHPEGYAAVAGALGREGVPVVLIGAGDETRVCRQIRDQVPEVVDLSGRVSLTDTLYVMANCCLALCNDSMALHMASALKRPTVAVFCATSPAFGFGPWKNSKAVVAEAQGLDCKPCRRHGSQACPSGTELCMHLSHDIVFNACLTVLDRQEREGS
ncbi:MAG: glycosyltransferase family 9 protein [Pseudomonadota bacterium]